MAKTCSIDGCEKTLMCRSWCPMHYQRWRTHGDPNVTTAPAYHPRETPGRAAVETVCAICSQTFVKRSRAHHPAKITCSTACRDVLRMWATWVNAPVTYKTVHNRLHFARGPASARACACGAPAREWAYVGHRAPGDALPFSTDVRLYVAMCSLCHQTYDRRYRRYRATS